MGLRSRPPRPKLPRIRNAAPHSLSTLDEIMNINPFDPNKTSDEVLRGVYDIVAAVEREEFPEDEPAPFEYWLTRWRAPSPEHQIHHRFYAESGGRVVGYLATLRLPLDDPANMMIRILVSPGHRGRGIGRILLGHALDWSEPFGIEKLIADAPEGWPVEAVMKRLGMRHSMTVRRSRLKMADVDWDLMDRWIEKARERATDYELVRFESRVSDEHLEQWARIKNVMNTAPREDLEAADFDMTPEKWRAEEDTADIRGDDYFAIGALHRPTGEFAGLTDVFLPRHFPQQAWQEDTGVDPAHRNKGLGRWLKAEMITWIATDRPEVERIDTHNAGSNEPMLAINVEMGFKPVLIENVWQGNVDEIRAKLSTGTVAV